MNLQGNDGLGSAGTAAAAAAVFLALVGGYFYLSSGDKSKDEGADEARAKKRRLSFTSVGLGMGSFPPEAEVKEPIINAALYFAEGDCPTADEIESAIIRPLLKYERMNSIPDLDNHTVRPSRRPAVEPSDFVRTIHVDGGDDLAHRTIVQHLQDPLGSGRNDLPWWEVLVVRNARPGTADACVLRFHHVIGDGIAFVTALEKLLTNEDGSPVQSGLDVLKGSGASSGEGKKKKEDGAGGGKKKSLLSTAWSLLEAFVHVLTLGATKYDDDTAFSKMNNARLKHCGKREAVLFPTVPLSFVKALKDAAGVSVNDVLMVAVGQAIRDYCAARDDPLVTTSPPKGAKPIQCRALLPVGFPRPLMETDDPATALRNKWCMVSCDVGVCCEDIMDRVRFVHEKTLEMKSKPRAYVQLEVQNRLGPYTPVAVGQKTVFDTFSRHSLVLTNVPGPPKKMRFAGRVVQRTQLFFDNLLTQVDLISYAGEVYGNMVYDPVELPEADDFGRFYAEALVQLAGRLDVPCPPEMKEFEEKS